MDNGDERATGRGARRLRARPARPHPVRAAPATSHSLHPSDRHPLSAQRIASSAFVHGASGRAAEGRLTLTCTPRLRDNLEPDLEPWLPAGNAAASAGAGTGRGRQGGLLTALDLAELLHEVDTRWPPYRRNFLALVAIRNNTFSFWTYPMARSWCTRRVRSIGTAHRRSACLCAPEPKQPPRRVAGSQLGRGEDATSSFSPNDPVACVRWWRPCRCASPARSLSATCGATGCASPTWCLS